MSRCAAGSTGDGRPGAWPSDGEALAALAATRGQDGRGRRGCACAGGNRAPCAGDGCSAGTYACSRASLSVVFRDVHTGGISSAPFGWHRPPTALQRPSVDMRHRSTPGDRPTVRAALRQGQTTAVRTGPAEPVDEGLPAPPRRLLRSPHRGSPPPSDQPDHDPRVTPATVVAKGPLNRENVVQLAFTVRLGQGLCPQAGVGFTTCGQNCGPNTRADRPGTECERRRREPWSRQRRTSARPGAASSTTSSPTSGPGCGPASRSPSTRARRSSPCPTSSPAASSRAGCAASSRTPSPWPSAARSGSRSPSTRRWRTSAPTAVRRDGQVDKSRK